MLAPKYNPNLPKPSNLSNISLFWEMKNQTGEKYFGSKNVTLSWKGLAQLKWLAYQETFEEGPGSFELVVSTPHLKWSQIKFGPILDESYGPNSTRVWERFVEAFGLDEENLISLLKEGEGGTQWFNKGVALWLSDLD